MGLFSHKKTRIEPLEPMKTSPGKLKMYLQCPMKYKYTHIEPRQGEPRSRAHLIFDSLLKKSLEIYEKQLITSFEDIPEDYLIRQLESHWDPDQFNDADDPEAFHAAAQQAAVNMTHWLNESAGTPLTYRNQPAVAIFLPWICHPVTVWTRLDRIERLRDGTIRIVSFKSGQRQTDPENMSVDLSVRLIAAAAREHFGRDVNRFTYVYMRTGDMVEVPLDSLELESLPQELMRIVRSIQSGDFPPEPGPLCSVCEFISNCEGWKTLPWTLSGETRETYAKRLRLSYSKMSLFERCPRTYRKLYVDGIPPRPQPFFSFGSCLHAVMEVYYDGKIKRKRDLPFLLEILDEKWKEYRIGYHSESEEHRYREKARNMLEAYYNRFVAHGKFKPAAFIEEYFEMPVGPDSIMTGFIDRIDRRGRKQYIVLDYKTEPTDRSQEAVDKDLQLTLYYWAATEFLNLNITELGLFMMSHDKLILTTRSKAHLPELFERIISVTEQIRQETEFAPKINKYCLSCDHLVGCPLESEIRSRKDLRTMEFTEEDD